MRSALKFEDSARDAIMGTDNGFSVLEDSPNRSWIECFFDCGDGMVILLTRFVRFLELD